MSKQLVVTSPYPNLRGRYTEKGSFEGKPAFVRDTTQGDASATWVFHSAKFGRGPCWYFARSLPVGGSLNSFCCSADDATTPEAAQWDPNDIVEVRDIAVDVSVCMGAASSGDAVMDNTATIAAACLACTDLKTLRDDLSCSSCAPCANSPALDALSLLKDYASSAVRKQLANALASNDTEVKQRLDDILAAYRSQTTQPLILAEPPPRIEIGINATTLTCEAFCFSGVQLRYQWFKNGAPLPRAERPRFMLCGAGPRDEGSYVCVVSAGAESVSTRACEVMLSVAETTRRTRIESPLRRAAEAQKSGDIETAVSLLTEAIGAAEGNEIERANMLCQRAELLLQLGRLHDALRESTEILKISPGLARAYAIRGTVAAKLGHLAEAVSSWEAAELLGGVPEAAREAEMCRQRLDQFFEEQQAKRNNVNQKANFAAGNQDAGDGNDNEEANNEGSEGAWRRSGWRGRHTGRPAGGFFGAGSGSTGSRGSGSRAPELQRHLQVLGLTLDAKGALPSQEIVRGAYRRLALQAHPDKPGGSKTAFQELQNAYEAVLSAVAA